MKETTIDQTLVLCDLDSLLLDAAGNLPQLQRDVLQLIASRRGRLTDVSQRSPRAVRSLLAGVRLTAPALLCGATLAYNISESTNTAHRCCPPCPAWALPCRCAMAPPALCG